MASHTPGPWHAGHRTVTAPETEERLPLDVRIYGGNADDNRANARLIAAAPELLEAASLALGFAVLKWGNLDPDANTAFAQVRAAIAKATGAKP